jgi:hypothetical protein
MSCPSGKSCCKTKVSKTQISRQIKNLSRQTSSTHIMKMSMLMISQTHRDGEVGVGVKHDSYARYLARKKAPHIIQTDEKGTTLDCGC